MHRISTLFLLSERLDENGNQVVVDVPYRNYMVHALVWRVNVGRIKLYLLDTDNDMNSEFDRPITHSLYVVTGRTV